MKRAITLILTLTLLLSLCAFGGTAYAADEITITDMIGREVTVTPGSYRRVVCIGAGALRMYSYIGDVSLLCGVEDIDNTSLAERPKMFDSVARPYMLAYGERFTALPSCGVGGPQAQTAEAEKILACNPDIVISEYEDVEKEDALQEQLGVPVITLKAGPGGVFDENFFGTMRMLGTIFQNEEKAEALVSFIEAERAEISRRTADVADADKPSVYICGLGNWGTTNHLMTAQNYISFNVANVKNAVTDLAAPGIQAIEEEKFVSLGEDMDLYRSVRIWTLSSWTPPRSRTSNPSLPRRPTCLIPARPGRMDRFTWKWPTTPTTRTTRSPSSTPGLLPRPCTPNSLRIST